MISSKYHIISDFNIEPLQRIINSKKSFFQINKFYYSNVFEQLNFNKKSNNLLIWLNAENIFKSVNSYIKTNKISFSKLDKEILEFCSSLINIAKNNNKIILNSFCFVNEIPFSNNFLFKGKNSRTYVTNYINNKLAENLANYSAITFVDINNIFNQFNGEIYNYQFYIGTKSTYTIEFYNFYADFLEKLLIEINLSPKKIIVLDLDDTLWGGNIGDLGINKINLGGNDIYGESFKDFQNNLLNLKNVGIQLAIASKNEEKIAMNAIKNHPEMILRPKDFVIWKINWEDKVNNIIEISKTLNLNLDSFVFFDNSNFERKNVIERIPKVLTPDLSTGPLNYVNILNNLKCFNNYTTTIEDSKRTKFYKQNLQRQELQNKILSKEKWIKQLNIKIKLTKFKKINFLRVLQLLNKTNQMNLTTNRYSEESLETKISSHNFHLYVADVSDKFGDYGLTGIISLLILDENIIVNDFVLSCRVMGRQVEQSIFRNIHRKYKKKIIFKYKKTTKNKPIYDLLKDKNQFKELKKNQFIYINSK
ncbi:MAG: hypothetical protein CMD08_03060 [Flavobacteriales bacterium]|nr:hypothetical protein [Flavobacteriales bacterium]